jgi:hypothetical protein
VVKLLSYKSEGRWFDPSCCHWNFSLTYKNLSNRTMALWSTQPPTEMSTRRISWGKGGRCVRLTTLPPFWAIVTISGNLNFLEPSGHLGPVMGLIYLYLYRQFNIKQFYVLPTQLYLCVLCGSQNKQRLFPYTA